MTDILTHTHLRHFTPFARFSKAHLDHMLDKARLLTVPTGKTLFKRGEPGKQCYFLLSGAVDLTDIEFNLTRVNAGDDGARDCLNPIVPHSHAAITKEPCALIVIDRDDLNAIPAWEEPGEYLVTELVDEEEGEVDWMQSLLCSHLLLMVPMPNIQQLFARFRRREVRRGENIVRQGEEGQEFFVIARGNARVTQLTPRGEEELSRLVAGQFFGEEALVGDTVRNANVSMLDNGVLMCLGKDDFNRLLRDPLIKTVTRAELETLGRERNVRIIDVRLRWEYKQGHVEGAECIPLKGLRAALDALDKRSLYAITCDGGRRSELGAYLFSEKGLDARVLKP